MEERLAQARLIKGVENKRDRKRRKNEKPTPMPDGRTDAYLHFIKYDVFSFLSHSLSLSLSLSLSSSECLTESTFSPHKV